MAQEEAAEKRLCAHFARWAGFQTNGRGGHSHLGRRKGLRGEHAQAGCNRYVLFSRSEKCPDFLQYGGFLLGKVHKSLECDAVPAIFRRNVEGYMAFVNTPPDIFDDQIQAL